MSLTPRENAVLQFKDMMSLRRMLHVLSTDFGDWRREKGYAANKYITDMKEELQGMRVRMRDRTGDPLMVAKTFRQNEVKEIKRLMAGLVQKRKFLETIIVGGKDAPACNYKMSPGYSRRDLPSVTLVVGHMWRKRVWNNLYVDMKNPRLLTPDYIILSAVEYRTNVPHVRLYEAIAYGIKEKGRVNGWVGQSKLGKQHCAFKPDKIAAIKAAETYTVHRVNEQLKPEGETTNG